MSFDGIEVIGASEHNLKALNFRIPRNQITVITGLSGSGKSSLAFDTLFAEGQRRYIESLSSYAKQFLDQLKRPRVERISGLSPAIAIHQKTISSNPRSTVGTVTEISDFLRLLFSRVGQPKCPQHGIEVSGQSVDQIFREVFNLPAGTRLLIAAPIARSKKGEFTQEIRSWEKRGFKKIRVDGQILSVENVGSLKKTKPHDIDVVVDQVSIKSGLEGRIRSALAEALTLGRGQVLSFSPEGEGEKLYSTLSACSICGFSFPDLEPRFFSFNHPSGACPACNGVGYEGAQEEDEKDQTGDDEVRSAKPVCTVCSGTRLRRESLSVFIDDKSIFEWGELSLREMSQALGDVKFSSSVSSQVASKIVEQIQLRISYLEKVGASYLSLNRRTQSLSGGEAQRIRLGSQMASSMIGVLYVLDEPSIGLHPRDHDRLMSLIEELRDRGNTILVVEHDEETMLRADHLIDMGPGAGREGGEILFEGTLAELKNSDRSVTRPYLFGDSSVSSPVVPENELASRPHFQLLGASGHNLKGVDLSFPSGAMVAITGVSGSGKSSLIMDTLYPFLARELNRAGTMPLPFQKAIGVENFDRVIPIDQSPIGRTPRSTPATYVGVFPLIRDLFAQLPEAQVRGYKPGRFSFNTKGGRCDHCEGQGQIKVEMHFMSDVYVPCEVCGGSRYNLETLAIRYRGLSIAEVLNQTVDEAAETFERVPFISRKLETLKQVGLGYIQLGQNSTTLSGGEAQRIKLAKELARRDTGRTLYILDEPTTGLHFADVNQLVKLLQSLVKLGNTVLVIEHNTDLILASDYIVDLGPEGGAEGGEILASGTLQNILNEKRSLTGEYLRKTLEERKKRNLLGETR